MTDLQTAAQQALEALEDHAKQYPHMQKGYTVDAIAALRAALAQQAEPVEPVAEFDHRIGADRFKVVRGAYWWHILIGDSPTKRGKFHTQAGAEEMAALLLREFRNGAFVQHNTAPPQRKPLTEEMEARCPYAKANPTLRGAFFDGWLNSERAHGITDPQVADRLARHGIPMPEGDPKC